MLCIEPNECNEAPSNSTHSKLSSLKLKRPSRKPPERPSQTKKSNDSKKFDINDARGAKLIQESSKLVETSKSNDYANHSIESQRHFEYPSDHRFDQHNQTKKHLHSSHMYRLEYRSPSRSPFRSRSSVQNVVNTVELYRAMNAAEKAAAMATAAVTNRQTSNQLIPSYTAKLYNSRFDSPEISRPLQVQTPISSNRLISVVCFTEAYL